MGKFISNSSRPAEVFLSILLSLIIMNEQRYGFTQGFEESVCRDVVVIDNHRVEVGFAY
jgi:hypothetical protein